MRSSSKNLRTCSNGHKYYKSSNCPVCPICEKEQKAGADFLNLISAPARRVLEREGIDTILKLSKFTEKEILRLHGMGPGTIPKLKKALKDEGLSFRKHKHQEHLT